MATLYGGLRRAERNERVWDGVGAPLGRVGLRK